MRNSINYNLKYFIMKMSGTKPLKNTMRKQSPVKQTAAAVTAGVKKATEAKTATITPKPSRPVGKPNTAKPSGSKAVTPALQLKKHKK